MAANAPRTEPAIALFDGPISIDRGTKVIDARADRTDVAREQ